VNGVPGSRKEPLGAALAVSYASAAWGTVIGALSVAAGVSANSTALVGTGADVLADLLSTMVLIWRFRAEQAGHHAPHRIERRAQVVAASCLLVVAVGLIVTASLRLASGQGADPTLLSVTLAGASALVLPGLSAWKYAAAAAVPSKALRTDAHIGVVGAATAVLALLGLVATRAFGWTSADPVAALLVAAIAAVTGVISLAKDEDD
jgi:divalent metal cation (Fe/Co/Zn/Cd) transporter